jgi:peptidase S51-like protein
MAWLVARFSLGIFLICSSLAPAASAKWKYWRTGNAEDSSAVPRTGFALMGGGAKQEAAFQFLCERTNGRDFLILRAQTEDEYAETVNKEIFAMCPLNSVATIVFDDRENADDSKVVEIIDQAETIFIAGGDQSNYVRFWQDTPVQNALNRHIAAGKPIGGSSAGLAVLGEFSFSSMIDTIPSPEASLREQGHTLARLSAYPAARGCNHGHAFCETRPHGAAAGVYGANFGRWLVEGSAVDCRRGECGGAAGSGRHGESHWRGCRVFPGSEKSSGDLPQKRTTSVCRDFGAPGRRWRCFQRKSMGRRKRR